MTDQPAEPPPPARPTLAELTVGLDAPDSESEWAVRAALRDSGLPPGALGRLEAIAVWLGGAQHRCPPTEPQRARLVVFAADHGIRAAGVSAATASDSGATVAALTAGRSVTAALADLAGVGLRIVDIGVDADTQPEISAFKVRRGSGRIDNEDALSADETADAIAAGAAVADEEIDAGADLLLVGELGIGSTTVAATLISLLTATEPVRVVGRGGGIDDGTWMRKISAIRDARRRGLPHRHDMSGLLAAVGGADVAALTGFLLRASTRRTPVLLDGVVTTAAALVARDVDPLTPRWWQAATASREPAHGLALDRLRLSALTDTSVDLGVGAGAVLAVPLLRAAVRATAAALTEAALTRSAAPESVPDVGGDEGRLDQASG